MVLEWWWGGEGVREGAAQGEEEIACYYPRDMRWDVGMDKMYILAR